MVSNLLRVAPADQHIKYTNRYPIKDPEAHTFLGKPRPELDVAWHGLLKGMVSTDAQLQNPSYHF